MDKKTIDALMEFGRAAGTANARQIESEPISRPAIVAGAGNAGVVAPRSLPPTMTINGAGAERDELVSVEYVRDVLVPAINDAADDGITIKVL